MAWFDMVTFGLMLCAAGAACVTTRRDNGVGGGGGLAFPSTYSHSKRKQGFWHGRLFVLLNSVCAVGFFTSTSLLHSYCSIRVVHCRRDLSAPSAGHGQNMGGRW